MDIVILSHLRSEPAHGYELKRKVGRTTAYELHNNTLYPALRRFEEAGAVRKTAEQQEGRPPKHVYELTAVGHELLHDLISEFPAELAGNEEEFLTRLGLFDDLTPAEQHDVLATRDQALSARLAHLVELTDRAAGSPRHHTWGGRVVAELRARAERERAWLVELDALVDSVPDHPKG